MSSLKDVITSYPALQEFGVLAQTILPIMTSETSSRETKRSTLNDLVSVLSDKTFSNGIVVDKIMEIINMKEDVCREYKDAEAQVEGILSWLPRMKQHRDKLKQKVKKHRIVYKLKV